MVPGNLTNTSNHPSQRMCRGLKCTTEMMKVLSDNIELDKLKLKRSEQREKKEKRGALDSGTQHALSNFCPLCELEHRCYVVCNEHG